MMFVENKLPKNPESVVSVDVELFNMDKRRLHRVSGEFASLAICGGDKVYLITDKSLVPKALSAIRSSMWIMHNAGFDFFHSRRWKKFAKKSPKKFWDTMIWERLLWNGHYDSFALDDLARRYLNIQMDKSIRKKFEKATSLTAEMKEYAALDAWVTRKIYPAQIAVLEGRDNQEELRRLWHEIEAPMVELVPRFKGFKINTLAWETLATANATAADAFKKSLPYNPASPQQVRNHLITLGVTVPNTQAGTLKYYLERRRLSMRARNAMQNVLKFRKAAKLAGTYGHKFLSYFLEDDGRIHAHYWVIGAATGRMSSADPNMQNIPRDKIFRSCFVADKGMKLIIADYAQQETRILAHMSQDPALINIFERGIDPHLLVARRIYRDAKMKKNDPRRFHGKTIDLAMPYGLTAAGLAAQTDLSEMKAQALIDSYFREFPQVQEYMKHYRWLGQRNGYVDTQYGRRIYLNLYTKQWLNNAVNAPIQGGAADQIKLALVLLDKACKKAKMEYPVVEVTHDEIGIEVPESDVDMGAALVKSAMLTAGELMFPSVPWKVDIKIGKHWGIKE